MIKFNYRTPMKTKQHSSEGSFLLVEPNKLGFKLFYSKHFNFEKKICISRSQNLYSKQERKILTQYLNIHKLSFV